MSLAKTTEYYAMVDSLRHGGTLRQNWVTGVYELTPTGLAPRLITRVLWDRFCTHHGRQRVRLSLEQRALGLRAYQIAPGAPEPETERRFA